MNALPHIISWMLIHSLWIGLLCWALVRIFSSLTSNANTRKLFRLGVLCLFVLACFAMVPDSGSMHKGTMIRLVTYQGGLNPETDHWLSTTILWVNQNSEFISLIWLAGMCLALFRVGQSHKVMKRYQSGALNCTENRLIEKVLQLRQQMSIKRAVALKVSSLINSPMCTGILKPVIYLPLGLSNGLLEDELDAILQHELAHIKHHDFVINYFLVILETLFFFNPMVTLMARELRQEMEYACDDLFTRDQSPITYSRALLKLQELSSSGPLTMAANPNNSDLKKRINRMIHSKKVYSPKLAIIVMALALFAFGTAFIGKSEAEPPTKPEELLPEFPLQESKSDTLRFTDMEALKAKLKAIGFEKAADHVFLLNGTKVLIVTDANNSLRRADEMMEEIQKELIADGLLREDRPKMTLMFQYSDLLNGKANLGRHYEKYKGIFNRYFPRYDSYATTRVFRYQKD